MPIFNSKWFWPITTFISAGAFRLFYLNLIEFKFDEASAVFQMSEFIKNPTILMLGQIQSTGVYNPPLYYYLLIIPAIFSRNPLLFSFFIALVNSSLIVLFYFTLKKFYSQTTAITSSLLMAFSPWNIIFSRKIWTPDFLLLLVIPFLYFFHQLLFERKQQAILPLTALLFLIPQLHASGYFFLFTTIIVLILVRIKINFKSAVYGLLLALIPLLPFIYFQLTSDTFCPDCQTFIRYQQLPKPFDFLVLLRPLSIINGFSFNILLGESFNKFYQSSILLKPIKYVFLFEYLLLIPAIFLIIKKHFKNLFLVIYLLLIPLLYLITRTPSYMHYFIILTPFIFIIYGMLFNFLLNLKNIYFKYFSFIALMIIIFSNIAFQIIFNNFLINEKIIQGDYGPIYTVTEEKVSQKLQSYQSLPNYEQIKHFMYLFAQDDKLFDAKLQELKHLK